MPQRILRLLGVGVLRAAPVPVAQGVTVPGGLPDATEAETHRRPAPTPLGARERVAESLASALFLVTAVVLALRLPETRSFSAGQAVLLLGAYVACARVKFYAGAGYTTPAQVVFVAMLFILPLGIVPLMVVAGLLLAMVDKLARREIPLDRLLLIPADAWYSIAPVLVLAAAGSPAASAVRWPILLAVLAAQFGGDLIASITRERFAYGMPARVQMRVLSWVWMVDAALSPLGLLAALASAHHAYAFALALPMVGLIAVFARERNARIEHALQLSATYRGTALLLGDLLEHVDSYTGGKHTAGVVSLSGAVAAELGLDARRRRRIELAAMLHDVGKMAIPPSIISKPAPLDDEEWAIMRTHTIHGQRMLDRVGGALSEIGAIVRSSHERFDGGGYPDGLTGPAIPVEAAVVAVCDAYDAMTTDRPYRRARSDTAALTELRAEAGRQFSPPIVAAVERVLIHRNRAALRRRTRFRRPTVDWSAQSIAEMPSVPVPAHQSLPNP